MKINTLISILFLSVLFSNAFADTVTEPIRTFEGAVVDYWPGQVIVKFREGTQKSKRRFLRSRDNASLIKTFSLINAEVWQVEDVEAAISSQQRQRRDYSDIEYMEPNYVIRLDNTANDVGRTTRKIPNDPQFDQLWGLEKIGATKAWDITTGSPIVCAEIGTGVDYTHPDLAANMWQNPGEIPDNGIDDDGNGYVDDVYGYDFLNDDGDPFDEHGIGTHVAGIIAGVSNNGIGITGINWSAKIMALKIIDEHGIMSLSSAIYAIEYATKMGVKCSNNGWGGNNFSQALFDAIQAAGDAGQLFIAAAGIEDRDDDVFPHYPSSYDLDNIISVCATDHNDNLSDFSDYGRQSVDLCAPGSDIFSTIPNNEYSTHSGTSTASSYISGAVALLWSAFPHMTATEVKAKIMDSVDRIPAIKDRSVTGGRLNVYKLFSSNQPPNVAFTVSQNRGEAPLTITLDAGDSSDPDGLIVTYEWRINDALFSLVDNSDPLSFSRSQTLFGNAFIDALRRVPKTRFLNFFCSETEFFQKTRFL
jgi:subtilisin family serine protease